jgi:hypothetical protein
MPVWEVMQHENDLENLLNHVDLRVFAFYCDGAIVRAG